MKDNHNHDHSHKHSTSSYDSIIFVMLLNLIFAILELFSYIITGSIAMLSSSLHDLGDVLIFFFSALVEKYSLKGRTNKYTYGYRRFSVLGAIINVIVLTAGSIIIIIGAFERFINPSEIATLLVALTAIIGIFVNKIGAYKLSKKDSVINRQLSLNLKSDVYNFYALLIGSLIIKITGFYFIDALFAIIIALMMLYHIKDSIIEISDIIMMASPKDINLDKIILSLYKHEEIIDIHDIHLWNLDGEDYIFTCHIVVDNDATLYEVTDLKETILNDLFKLGINHSTIEFDTINSAKKNELINL